jgi:hypothetical protein
MQFTVYFDGQFWVGVAEDPDYDPPRVARHVFGAEPNDTEALSFVNHHLLALLARVARDGAQPRISGSASVTLAVNPKRRAREAAVVVRQHGVSTKAQAALQQQREACQQERAARSRQERDAELERKWLLKRKQAKARRRGQ